MTGWRWNEGNIGAALARNTFDGHLCCLPNCTWTGDEVDLLVVAKCLRVIDVEIKISRADLKADIHKQKWWQSPAWAAKRMGAQAERLEWPRKVWKHYYALPADIWHDDLLEAIPAVSGVLLVKRVPAGGGTGEHVFRVTCARRSKPCRDAARLTAEHVMQLARLTSLRLWDVYKESAA
jgi:hypothetical protein